MLVLVLVHAHAHFLSVLVAMLWEFLWENVVVAADSRVPYDLAAATHY